MRPHRVVAWTLVAVAFLAGAGALLPIAPEFLTQQLDASFGATLHYGAAHGYAAGSRLISTFGPLGFVFYGWYFPATFAWLLALRAVLAVATCWALAWIGYAAWDSPWGAAAALFGCVPFFASPDVWFLTLPVLALLIQLAEGHTPPAALQVALGIAIGLASLIKFTVLLAALVVLVPLTLSALLARRVPLVSLAALGATGLGWVATGNGWADGLAYLDWSLREISPGYAAAMQLPPSPSLQLHAAAVSAAVLGAGALLVQRRLRAQRAAALIALAGVLYVLFRAGFTRADVHVFITVFGLLAIAVLVALLSARRPAQVAVAAGLVVLVPGSLWARAVALQGHPTSYFRAVFPDQAFRRLAALPIALRSNAFAQTHARQMEQIRTQQRLPPLPGTVDVYPFNQALPLAYDLDFQPRPVFQSYMAFTPRLARANADFLIGDAAPQWILFSVYPIDDRMPALEDALSWPLLMARYRLVGPVGPYALLRRRETPLPWRLEPLWRVETLTGEAVLVPSAAEGPIWARIDLHETRRDAVVGSLLAAPLVYIGIARIGGQVELPPGRRDASGFRLVPALAREGFVLSPVVASTDGFMRLMSLDKGPDPVRAYDAAMFMVQIADTPGIAAEPRTVTVEFLRLRIGG